MKSELAGTLINEFIGLAGINYHRKYFFWSIPCFPAKAAGQATAFHSIPNRVAPRVLACHLNQWIRNWPILYQWQGNCFLTEN
jgi:hypothetical protein